MLKIKFLTSRKTQITSREQNGGTLLQLTTCKGNVLVVVYSLSRVRLL